MWGLRSSRRIRYWFEVVHVPAGGAPLHIREQWVGVVMPVRRPRPRDPGQSYVGREVGTGRLRYVGEGVAVEIDDALRALDAFGRHEARTWWERHPDVRGMGGLAFRLRDGNYLPLEIAYGRHPELERWDDA